MNSQRLAGTWLACDVWLWSLLGNGCVAGNQSDIVVHQAPGGAVSMAGGVKIIIFFEFQKTSSRSFNFKQTLNQNFSLKTSLSNLICAQWYWLPLFHWETKCPTPHAETLSLLWTKHRPFFPVPTLTSKVYTLCHRARHLLNPISGHEQPRGSRHQCARNKPSSPELPDSIHLLGVKVMHTAVTGGSHCIPSDPSRDINFAWARGPLSEFLSLAHFFPTTPPLFRTVVGHRHKREWCQPAGCRAREKSITQALADNPTIGHAAAQSCMLSGPSSLLWGSIHFFLSRPSVALSNIVFKNMYYFFFFP